MARREGSPVPRALLACLLGMVCWAQGAGEAASPSLFRDPKDGAFDVSGWLATRTGVLPVLVPITEPAVGYGAALALVSFQGGGLAGALKPPKGASGRPVPPNIAVVGGGLTENGTWAGFAGYLGHFDEDRWRTKSAVVRLSPNLDVYDAQDQAYRFNLDGWAVYQEVARRLGPTDLFVGVQAVWLDTTVRFDLDRRPPDMPPPSQDTTEAGLGLFLEYDSRNNSLSPSRGASVKASAGFVRPWMGADHDFDRYTLKARSWWDPHPRLILWARAQGEAVSGTAPFYALPFIYLRGIPVMRYQGEQVLSVDGEVAWNAWRRWWLVGFAGTGWTSGVPGPSQEGDHASAGGVGFRYLLARALGLQAGLDVAKGPEETAVYLVVGTTF